MLILFPGLYHTHAARDTELLPLLQEHTRSQETHMNSLPSSSALQTHSPHTHTFTLIPVIPEVSRVDWTRLMGDICPGWISIWVRNLWNKVSGLHTHINTPVPKKQGRRGFVFPPNQKTAQSEPSRHTIQSPASTTARGEDEWSCHATQCDSVR